MAKKQTAQEPSLAPEIIEQKIYLIRGHKVMLDRDLAQLYGVPTFRLNEAVKRNKRRFPEDFIFQLDAEETMGLTSQIAMSKGRGGRRTFPYSFTEQGVAMPSSVLNSERAIQVNIAIMRAFVKIRQLLATHTELAQRLDDLERKYDEQFHVVFEAIRKLINTPEQNVPPKRRIGFPRPAELEE